MNELFILISTILNHVSIESSEPFDNLVAFPLSPESQTHPSALSVMMKFDTAHLHISEIIIVWHYQLINFC